MVSISFIIPVYNSEDTVEYSVKSITSYPMQDIEVILIDDGSTDNSLMVCRNLAQKDPRISVYHKENEGPSLTRNLGIEHATGKYIFFLDSDDRALMQGIEILYKKAEELEQQGEGCDVIQGFYYRVIDGKRELVGEGFPNGWISRNGSPEEVKLYHRIKTESAFGYTTNKLYRRETLNKYNIRFSPLMWMEDQAFNLELWSHNPGYYIENQPLFEYWLRSQSLSQGYNPQAAINSVKLLEVCYEYLSGCNLLEENLDLFVPLAMRLFCWSLVKNIPFEHGRLDKIQSRTKILLDSPAFQYVISKKEHRRELNKLPSFLQRIFYSFCFICAKWQDGYFISCVMKLGTPVFTWYLNHNVK